MGSGDLGATSARGDEASAAREATAPSGPPIVRAGYTSRVETRPTYLNEKGTSGRAEISHVGYLAVNIDPDADNTVRVAVDRPDDSISKVSRTDAIQISGGTGSAWLDRDEGTVFAKTFKGPYYPATVEAILRGMGSEQPFRLYV